MVQTIFMTDEEKRTMYAKLSKKDVIELLIESQKHVERLLPVMYYPCPCALTSDIMVKYDFRLAVLEKSEYYPFGDIGFNLDQWIDWLYYHNYSIEEAAKILDERYNELLLIYASKQKGL